MNNSVTASRGIDADKNAISATDVILNGNSGLIEATGANGVAINATGTATVSNDDVEGVIRANGVNGVAIHGTTVNITANAGMITGGQSASKPRPSTSPAIPT